MIQLPVLFRCRICGVVFPPELPADGSPRHDRHPTRCPEPVAKWHELYEKEEYPCYSGGKSKPDTTFSNNQLTRDRPYARCSHCISAQVRSRFDLVAKSSSWKSNYDVLGEALVDAVGVRSGSGSRSFKTWRRPQLMFDIDIEGAVNPVALVLMTLNLIGLRKFAAGLRMLSIHDLNLKIISIAFSKA